MRRHALAFVLAAVASAAHAQDGTGFWIGGDVGGASLHRSYSITGSTSTTELALAVRGGYAWHPRLLLGIETGGWSLQAADDKDSSRGEGLRTLYAVAQFYLDAQSRFYARAGVGGVKYWNNRPGETGASGTGAVLGAGYEPWRSGPWSAGPSIDYSWGKFTGATSPPGILQDQEYRAVTLRFGFTFR